MEQRNKTLYVSKTMKQKRAEDLERITSPYGIQLRVNRSIQAERSFASVKQDMEFRRYMYRGKENVTAQSVILAIAHNINKLHNKIQTEKENPSISENFPCSVGSFHNNTLLLFLYHENVFVFPSPHFLYFLFLPFTFPLLYFSFIPNSDYFLMFR